MNLRFRVQNKKELFFAAGGVLILLSVAVFFVYFINRVIYGLNSALELDSAGTSPDIRFNLEGLKELGIEIKERNSLKQNNVLE